VQAHHVRTHEGLVEEGNPSRACTRHRTDVIPPCLLKARSKAASDGYPTASPISAIDSRVASSLRPGIVDAVLLSQEFGRADNELPVIIVFAGHPAEGNWPQKPRRSVLDVFDVV
jgi:hypothetical protein